MTHTSIFWTKLFTHTIYSIVIVPFIMYIINVMLFDLYSCSMFSQVAVSIFELGVLLIVGNAGIVDLLNSYIKARSTDAKNIKKILIAEKSRVDALLKEYNIE